MSETALIPTEGKVLVKFSATWCQPCKSLTEIIKQSNLGDIPVIEVDIDQHLDVAGKYHIRGVPTLVLVENGNEVKRNVGLMTQQQLEQFV